MNERERAEALARAIDRLIRGEHNNELSVEDDDLRSLMRVAEARRQAGLEAGRQAADHESAVWQRLTARLKESDHAPAAQEQDMRDIIAARRRAAEDVHELAEQHREEVWRRVQEKVANQKPAPRRRIFGFLQARTEGDLPLRRAAWGDTSLILTGDPDTDSLMRVALANSALHRATPASPAQQQLRLRMRSDPARLREDPAPRQPERHHGPGLLLRAGAVALVVAAAAVLGPVPFTGLEGSPAAAAIRFAGDHLGVTETDQPPPAPGEATVIDGEEMSVTDAAARLRLPLSAPEALLGAPAARQQLFPAGADGGVFVTTYGDTLALYQEPAGGPARAVPEGTTVDTLVNGLPATYYEGAWVPGTDGALSWSATGAQTLVFERAGVRFTLVYTGAALTLSDFLAAAGTI